MRTDLSPLRIRPFRRLAASYAVNELGDNFGVVALAVLVFDRTGSALATAALFAAGKFVPAFVAPWVTARLDNLAVRRSLPALYALEAAAFAALALVADDFALTPVLVLAFVDGVLALTGRALSRAAVAAALSPRGILREGNAMLNVAFAVTSAIGPAAAGVLISATSASFALAVDAASFAAIALLLGAAADLPPARVAPAEPWTTRVRAGVAYVRARPTLRLMIAGQGLAFVFFFLVIPIEVVFAERTLDAGSAGFGAMLAAWGVGMVIGSAAFARFRGRAMSLLVGASTLLVGLGYLGLAASPGIVAACLASLVGGTGNGVQVVSVVTAVQESVSEEFQARVVGLLESVGAASPGIGYVLGGVLTSVWSPRVAYLVAGCGVVVIAAAMTRRLRSA